MSLSFIRLAASLGLCLCLAPGPASANPDAPFADRVVSEVAGHPIFLSTLVERTTEILKGFEQKQPVAGQRLGAAHKKALKASLQQLEHEALIANEARRLGVTVTAEEIDLTIDQVAAANGLTRADLIARLPESGLTEQSYRATLSRQILRMRLFGIHRSSSGAPSAAPEDVVTAQLAWLQELARRWPVVRHVSFGDEGGKKAAATTNADLCQATPGLPIFRWRLDTWPPSLATGRIAAVRHPGLPTPLPSQLSSLLQVRAGQVLDPAAVLGDLRRLWESGAFADVAAATRSGKDGVVLVYAVQHRPRTGQVEVQAAGALREPVIVGSLGLVAGQVVTPRRFREGLASLHQRLEGKGYLEATVEVRHRYAEGGRLDVCVRVIPGPEYRRTGVRFEGNEVLSDQILRKCLALEPGEPIQAEAWLLQQRLSSCAYDRGLINIKISGPERVVDEQAHTVARVFRIDEGKVYVLGPIDVAGDLIADPEVYLGRLQLKSGAVFSRAQLQQAIQRINDMHAAYGRSDLDVVPETNIDTDAGRIGVTLRIQKR